MSEKRRDNKGRILRTGESQRTDGRYMYKYVNRAGETKVVYSWKLVPTDRVPKGKRDAISLREKEREIQRDLEDGIDTKGKKCVILGRSNIVGKPMAMLMMQKACPGDATVTVCHSRSKDLVKECREADILIAAMGQPNFVTADMVKEGAVVIDVGTTRVPDATRKSGFKLAGDVKFDEVAPKCAYITPVPGGVGPMTIVSLMKNTLLAGKKAIY